jgi:hypothetical protein
VFFVAGGAMVLLGAAASELTVEDQGHQLLVRFGPLPLFFRRIRYDEILEVHPARTRLLDGWGIHWTPWSGTVWNIWGFQCVAVRLKRGRLKIGTDQPEKLAALLKNRIQDRSGPQSP